MLLPKEAVRACDGLYARNKSLAHSSDDNDRRRLTRMIVEQIAFALGDRWGCEKRAGLETNGSPKTPLLIAKTTAPFPCGIGRMAPHASEP